MIFHIVLFDPKPDLTATDREAFSRALERALRDIPSVREARVGRRVRHGAGYEAGMRESFEYAAVIGFDTLEGLREYLEHPAHQELGARFNASAARMLVYDYDMDTSGLPCLSLTATGSGPRRTLQSHRGVRRSTGRG